jgi:transcriptional antiterminator RfaH
MIPDGCGMPATSTAVRVEFPSLPCGSRGGHRWFVAHTEPGTEPKVRDRLEASGFGTFLPMVVVERFRLRQRWGRTYREAKRKTVVAFPTYLFVAFDPALSSWRRITSTRDVRRLLSSDAEHPLPVPDAAMAVLFSLGYDRPMVHDPVPALIKVGAIVTVKEGPFASFQGICQWSKKDRVGLLMSLFGRTTPAEFDLGDVEVND